jgi:hypothetical protein
MRCCNSFTVTLNRLTLKHYLAFKKRLKLRQSVADESDCWHAHRAFSPSQMKSEKLMQRKDSFAASTLLSFAITFLLAGFPYVAGAKETFQSGSSTLTSGASNTDLGALLPKEMDGEAKAGCKVAFAARLSADSARGSCDAGNSIKPDGQNPPMNDMCSAPAIATGKTQQQISQSTGKDCKYSQEGARCTLSGTTIDNVPNGKTDCSGFATGVLLRTGALFNPGEKLPVPLSTAIIKEKLANSSCWSRVKEKPQPGDMCVYNNGSVGHVWFVDRVDKTDQGNCTRIESTGGSDAKNGGISIAKGSEAHSDMSGSAGGCNAKEGKEEVICVRFSGATNCTDPEAKERRFKNESEVSHCSLGGS